ncbi:phage tail tip fiber protein [Gibbsiella quercinecans]|uniref:phage tail tip fiber protein n=1 Tax=Gibbsiella quercinecans TaxID=929813 RepID=UPI002431061F|nr:phage tail protein [Gibbsiella quercinecans]
MSKIITARKGGGSSASTPTEMPDNLISKDKIKLLLAMSDGEVVDDFSLKQLRMGGVPVQNDDGSLNYDGIIAEFRTGTQDQDYIQGFPQSSTETTIQRDVKKDTPYILTVSNKTLSAIRFRLFWPRIVKTEDNGDTVGSRVEYAFDMAVDGGAFQQYSTGVVDGKNTTNGYDRSIRIDLPQNFNSQVLIRVRRITDDADGTRTVDLFRVESYAEVIDAKFRYPLTAMLYVEFDSDLFGNNIPTISVKKKWKIIQVPSNYDPISRTYSGTWNGTFKWAWSNNPAWVLYDLITNQRYGLDQKELGVPVDKWSLYEVAQYCDQLVPDNRGGQEPRYLCDMVVQDQVEAYRLIRDVCSIFRGMSFYNGESLSIVVDKPRDPVYLFTNDNVIGGAFSYTFASEKSMYTTCNVMFDDQENNYKQDVEPVYDDEAGLRFGYNPTEITAIGCTRRTEANRRGRWILRTNLRSTTVNFATGLQGMIPVCGDVIQVQDPHWQTNYAYSLNGRVLEVDGLQVFTAYKIDARAGDFIIVNTPDGSPIKRTIAKVSADGKTMTLNVGFGFQVEPDAVFAIERTDLVAQLYVVTKIEKGSDEEEFQYSVTATEYDPGKYDAVDYGVITDQRPTSIVSPDSMTAPKNVTISSFSRVVQGMSVETMVVGWEKVQYATNYEMQWRKDGGNWLNTPRTPTTETQVEGIYAGEYEVRVRSVSSSNIASPWSSIAAKTLTGKVGKPKAPTSIYASTDEVFGIRVKWSMPDGSGDTAYIELQQSKNGEESDASLLTMVPYPAAEYWHSILPAGYENWYRCRAVDKIGNVSDWTDLVMGRSSVDVGLITDTILKEIEESEAFKRLDENAVDSAAKIRDSAQAILQNALANDSDVRRQSVENGNIKASITETQVLIANETEARAAQITELKTEFNEEISSSVTELKQSISDSEQSTAQKLTDLDAKFTSDIEASNTELSQAIANEAEARSTSEQALSARIGNNESAISQKLDSWVDASGAGAVYNLNLGLRYNGVEYKSGMAMQLTTVGGAMESQIIFRADRFAVLSAEDGSYSIPFVVNNGQVFINDAFIGNGSITNAKIGNVISSWDYVDGQSGWSINKDGNAQFNNARFRGYVHATDGIFDGTVYANKIVGDVTTNYVLTKDNPSAVIEARPFSRTVVSNPYIVTANNGLTTSCSVSVDGDVIVNVRAVGPSGGTMVRQGFAFYTLPANKQITISAQNLGIEDSAITTPSSILISAFR